MQSIEIALNGVMLAVYLVFWGTSFAILYHLVRFGVGVQPKRFSAIFLIGAVILFGVNVMIFANLNLASYFS